MSAVVAVLAGGREAAVRVAGRLEPLPARHEPASLPALRAALEREAAMRETLAALAPSVFDERALAAYGDPRRLVASVNTPDELAAARDEVVGVRDEAGP